MRNRRNFFCFFSKSVRLDRPVDTIYYTRRIVVYYKIYYWDVYGVSLRQYRYTHDDRLRNTRTRQRQFVNRTFRQKDREKNNRKSKIITLFYVYRVHGTFDACRRGIDRVKRIRRSKLLLYLSFVPMYVIIFIYIYIYMYYVCRWIRHFFFFFFYDGSRVFLSYAIKPRALFAGPVARIH